MKKTNSFADQFCEGFTNNTPDNYNYAEDTATDYPWCAPWLNPMVKQSEWFDCDKTPYEMGVAYAENVYAEVEEAFKKEEA